ncbi:hypothetical protein SDC9_185011 [bioreactor metagenome]|uniref:Uncharacterized protein n=1 Tax=bioreactor metagenome TaxID=1076179 RepID=A0A645HGH1_9ZZZZ
MPPVSAPETKVPPVKTPRAPEVERPAVKIPQPPVVPVAEVPVLTTQVVPPEQAPSRVSRATATSPATVQRLRTDDQGRKFHSAGTWKENKSFEVEAGKSVHFEITNNNRTESNLRIKANTGEFAEFVIPSQSTVDLEFSMAIKEPFIWRFYIETDTKKSLFDWNLYSTWVPGSEENQ